MKPASLSIIALILVSQAIASADAGPTCHAQDTVCTGEYQYNGCNDPYQSNSTEVEIRLLGLTYDSIRGYERCVDTPDGRREYTGVGGSFLFLIFAWFDNDSGCWMYVNAFGVGTTQRCVVAPPNPGWGHLLP